MKGRPAAVAALAAGEPVSVAADRAGVSRRTVQRWQTDPTFAAEVRALRSQILDDTAGRLASAAADAVATLATLVNDPEQPGHVRVKAGDVLLRALLPVREHVDIEQRLAAIEADEEGHRR
ncbi:helix-turn-helix domain-containing protein [Streptomyces sp. NPDC052492]|uniref:helix-turn-helix domain-containing protein n=1 Tax=Streptomyces sp. NPDC052492 TaxID=3365691 RepID=UPI0037D1C927